MKNTIQLMLWPRLGLALLLLVARVNAAERQVLPGHVPANVAALQPTSRLNATNRLDLVVALPLRNREDLTNLLQQVYDPASTNFHHYLSSPQFTERFGPSEKDYQTLMAYARSNGFTIAGTHPNRTLLDVNGSVGDIEKAFHVTMRTYQHLTEARAFYTPDVEPSLDLDTQVMQIEGLNNFSLPHSNLKPMPIPNPGNPMPALGTAPGNNYWGSDFRKVYAPGVALNGSGQIVAIMSLAGYYPSDITAYENQAGLPYVPITNLFNNGINANTGPYGDVTEISLDIEMVISMAPGIAKLMVYEGTQQHDIYNHIATDNIAKQISSSFTAGSATDPMTDQIFIQFAMQGQSCFQESGDDGARIGAAAFPADDPYVTLVGGTRLTTGSDGSWQSETVWNDSDGKGSGGGVSVTFNIPSWQLGIDMTANQGSTTMRNVPDVSIVATQIWVIHDNGVGSGQRGTSCAAPLWAGFCALINQQAAAEGKPPVGFLNPAIYAIGKGSGYAAAFRDVTMGSNTNPNSLNRWFVASGYDLCTGWGTPTGMGTINALVNFAGPVFVAFGASDPGNGTYDLPYNTMSRGTNEVAAGGTIEIKTAGSSSETMTITKAMNIQAIGGPAVIGHNTP